MVRRYVVLLAIIAAALAAFCSNSEGRNVRTRIFYYYMISDGDRSSKIQLMDRDHASEVKKEQKTKYREDRKAWFLLRKKWATAVGSKGFPVPPVRLGRVSRKARVPAGGGERLRKKYDRMLNKWDVCIVKNCKGERSAEVIRHDRVAGKRRKLLVEYAEAAIEWALALKEDPDAKKDREGAPVKPGIMAVMRPMSSADRAETFAEKLANKLEKDEEKRAAEKEKKEAEKQ